MAQQLKVLTAQADKPKFNPKVSRYGKKERTDSYKLPSGFHLCVMACVCTNTHTQREKVCVCVFMQDIIKVLNIHELQYSLGEISNHWFSCAD